MFESLLKNIEQEKKIIADLRSIHDTLKVNPGNSNFYMSAANSLLYQLRILNAAVPELLKEWSAISDVKKDEKIKVEKISSIPNVSDSVAHETKKYVVVNKEDRKNFLNSLKVTEQSLQAIQKIKKENIKKSGISKPSGYARISNKFFRNFSEKVAPNFVKLSEDLKKANIRFLLPTYLSIMFFSIIIAASLSVLIFIMTVIINSANWIYFWGVILLPLLVAAGFYLYPASEASSNQKSVTQELPFATIYMSAIAGSDISPLKIFKIIAMSKDYPNIGREIKKIIAQVDFYGNDIVTALKSVASNTSNKNLAELFSGIATNISTGGALKTYLQKKAENFLLDYRLERQKYTDLAGTFMDVYISVLIAAPLVLMMMFIVMNISGLGLAGLSISALMFISLLVIVVINIIFLAVVNMKQPKV